MKFNINLYPFLLFGMNWLSQFSSLQHCGKNSQLLSNVDGFDSQLRNLLFNGIRGVSLGCEFKGKGHILKQMLKNLNLLYWLQCWRVIDSGWYFEHALSIAPNSTVVRYSCKQNDQGFNPPCLWLLEFLIPSYSRDDTEKVRLNSKFSVV